MDGILQKTFMATIAVLACAFVVSPAYAAEVGHTDAQEASTATQQVQSMSNVDIEMKPSQATEKAASTSAEVETSATTHVASTDVSGESASEAVQAEPEIEATETSTAPAEKITIENLEGADEIGAATSKNAQVATAGVQSDATLNASATSDISMKATSVKNGWLTEDDETHYYANSKIQTGWSVNSALGNYGQQRYWLGAYGNLEFMKLSKTDASGSVAYSTSYGYAARGKFKEVDGNIYLANADGKLEDVGWLVTANYDGSSQKYYIDKTSRATTIGIFEVSNQRYYGLSSTGYVFRNDYDYLEGHWYTANNDGVLTNVDARFARVEAYVSWMLDIAADDSHGYDQAYRWGERGDYDCSSLVITAVNVAGINTGSASYTGNMRSAFTANGFYCRGFDNLKRGDILLNDDYHVAVYIGDGQIVHASGNEWGEAVGGEPGDQTGKEICVRSYYDRPWYTVLRFNC